MHISISFEVKCTAEFCLCIYVFTQYNVFLYFTSENAKYFDDILGKK
jgi:hypothetical protein